MTSLKKLHVHIIKRGENKYELAAISNDKVIWFGLPDKLKDLNWHAELLAIKTITSSMNSITKVGGYRKITITFKPELQQKYLDEDENFCINDHYLEEYVEESSAISSALGATKTTNEVFLIQRIKELENRISSTTTLSLSEIEHKFLVNIFNGKQEAPNWIDVFEKECLRFKVFDGTTKVEALKLFIEGNVKEWYSANLMKLPLSDWESWKRSFLLVYGKKSWSSVRAAFNYKYMFGSLIDFVLKKERLLLEADKNIPELFRIYQIVYNLPIDVQDKLERDKIKTINDLVEELKKFNDSYIIRKKLEDKQEEKKKTYSDKKYGAKTATMEKKPCSICEALGYKNRYHPIQICRNKTTQNRSNTNINLTEVEEDFENDVFKIDINED